MPRPKQKMLAAKAAQQSCIFCKRAAQPDKRGGVPIPFGKPTSHANVCERGASTVEEYGVMLQVLAAGVQL